MFMLILWCTSLGDRLVILCWVFSEISRHFPPNSSMNFHSKNQSIAHEQSQPRQKLPCQFFFNFSISKEKKSNTKSARFKSPHSLQFIRMLAKLKANEQRKKRRNIKWIAFKAQSGFFNSIKFCFGNRKKYRSFITNYFLFLPLI